MKHLNSVLRNLLLLFFVLIFFSNCKPPKIKKSKYLFQEMSYSFPVKDYDIILITKDSLYKIKNPKILENGNIEGESVNETLSNKKIIIYSKKHSQDIPLSVYDATNQSGKIQFSKDKVQKIIIRDSTSGVSPVTVYDKGYATRHVIVGGIFILVAGIIGFLLILAIMLTAVEGACFIATMVYGDYNAPEVLILRKFRDEKLAANIPGQIFIFLYYRFSPVFVHIFKNNRSVKKVIKSILDRLVQYLNQNNALTTVHPVKKR